MPTSKPTLKKQEADRQLELTINGSPTKDLFIMTLIKDIPLNRAIIDLVDNSLDGARRIKGTGKLSQFSVSITATPKSFSIEDTCGGIPVQTARDYAFRFGRPDSMKDKKHLIGLFGVGMKRALFKLGSNFTIESRTSSSYFKVTINVEQWKAQVDSDGKDDWSFKFDPLIEDASKLPKGSPGTKINVKCLHPKTSDDFKLENYLTNLKLELASAHQISLQRDLNITLNGSVLKSKAANFLSSPEIKTAYTVASYSKESDSPVTIKIYAGIAEPNPDIAGWNVFCNDRLVVASDQTALTGWGEKGAIPKYHNQFSRFRGCVFFDSDDARRLPWNTTKTGVDADSGLYKKVRRQMINIMRRVIDFLNDLDREKNVESHDRVLTAAIKKAKSTPLSKIRKCERFTAPVPAKPTSRKELVRITYHRPPDKVDCLKSVLGLTRKNDVGERTFDVVYEMECED